MAGSRKIVDGSVWKSLFWRPLTPFSLAQGGTPLDCIFHPSASIRTNVGESQFRARVRQGGTPPHSGSMTSPTPLLGVKGIPPSYPTLRPACGTPPNFYFTPSDGGLDNLFLDFLCKWGVPLLPWGVGVPLIGLDELPPLPPLLGVMGRGPLLATI